MRQRYEQVRMRVRQSMPHILGGAAVVGFALGLLIGHKGQRRVRLTVVDEERLNRQLRRLAKEREHLRGVAAMAESQESYDIP